jgi:hypothetical protein
MNREANAFSFIAGLSAGILNVVCALTTLLNAVVALEYVAEPALIPASAALLAVAIVNITGGGVCLKNRIAGGIMMLGSALPLLIVGAACLYFSLFNPDLFLSVIGAEFGEEVQRTAVGAGIFLIFAQLISLTAGVVSLAKSAKPKVRGA